MNCASLDAAMHIRKLRNKIHCPILDIQLNKQRRCTGNKWPSRRYFERDCSSNAKAVRHSLTTE